MPSRDSRRPAAASTSRRGLRGWQDAPDSGFGPLLLRVPGRVDSTAFWGRCVLWLLFAGWGWVLMRLDVATGEFMTSFIHRPLLIFHEAGHIVFMPFGEWLCVLGGTLGQLIMPLVLGGALLLKNRDPFGASIGLWLFGVSLLDVAPYMYDAFEPQLPLLGGGTGQDSAHDWVYLFSSAGALARSHAIGNLTHTLGALTVLLALGWGAWILRRQHANVDGHVLHEE